MPATVRRVGGPDHLAHLRTDVEAVAVALERSDPDTPVPGCPGWDLRTLAGHLGFVHRWSATALRTAAPPEIASIEPPPGDDRLAGWIRAGGEALVDQLAGTAPDAPTWHPFPAPQVAAVWCRRQAQETSVHRWDVQDAVGEPDPIDAALAADGVAEQFQVMLPRRFLAGRGEPPARHEWLELAATDVGARWWVRCRDGAVEVVDDEPVGRADTRIAGRAEDLLLVLYARRPAEAVAVSGDPSLAGAWVDLGGN